MESINKVEIHRIFQRLKNNEKDAIELLYKKYYNLVRNISFSIVKEKTIAEEISQIVFIKIMQMQNEKLPTGHEVNWLYTVTKNVTIEYLRKQNKYIDIDTIYDIADSQSEINEIIDRESFNKIIDSLDDKDKEVISLKILSNYTFKEIGYILNIPTGTVQWRYYKSIHTLKILLSNLSLFIITTMLYISSISKYKETDKNTDTIKDSPSQETKSFDSFAPSSITSTTSDDSLQINLFSNPMQVGLLGFSSIFLVMTIIFTIIFVKHQQKRHHKSSK